MEGLLGLFSFGPDGWGDELASGALLTIQLAIATVPFGLILGSAAIAAALAFGLGGRDFAARMLDDWQNGSGPPPTPRVPPRLRKPAAPDDDTQPPLM